MALILRPPWDVQPLELPRVNVAHPLASILVDAWVGSFPQITSDTVTAPSGIGSAVSGRGVGSTFGAYASTSIVSLPNTDRSRLVGVNGSIVAGVKFGTVASDTFPHIWAVRDATTQIALLSGGLNASTYSGGRIAFSAGGVDTISTASSLRQNAYAVYGAEWGTNGRKLFVDGSLDTTSASTAVVAATSIRPSLGNRQSGGRSLGTGSELYFCFTFSQNIGDKWHNELARDPYQLFERRIWVPVSAGGAPVLITATPGNAVAAGVQARVNQAHQVTGTAGNAVANGVAARVNQTRIVVGTAGNATAAGITARVDQARQITGSAGNAVADGEAASIYFGRLITATPGDAAAAGVAATIFNGAVIQATPGNAVAAGRPATILGDQIIVGNAGNATAVGVSAQIGQNRQITGNTANATAEGLLASIYVGVTVQATPAVAVADGVDATLLQAITISATAGNAVAAGRTARIIEGDAPIYAAIPASRKARGRFGERPAQLSTGRRR